MSHNLRLDANFHLQLLKLDQILLAETSEAGCPFCSGPLHQAHYPRTPFGVPVDMRHYYDQRFSLCCGQCRRRTTPQSVRFLGSRRFVTLVMVLISSQRSSPTEKRLERLFRRFNLQCSLTTWKRWRKWWKEQFPASSLWHEVRGLFVRHDAISFYPKDVLKQFPDNRLLKFLQLISPLSVQNH
jgi:hypothetical protein